MKKQILQFVLITAAVCVFLCACASAAEEEFTAEFDAESDVLDMNGFQFKIMQGYDETILFQYKADTLAFDLVKKRFKEIEDKYNCRITVENAPGDNGYLSSLSTRLMGNDYCGEIAFSHQPYAITHSGFLYPLDALGDYIDYLNAEKYGSLMMRGFSIDNNTVYTVSPIRWAGKQGSYAYSFFAVNEGILKKNGLTDPREYVENGTWYWDKFEEVLPLYAVSDGSERTMALNFTWNFPLDFAASNGYLYVNENLTSDNFNSPAVAEALDFLARICTEYQDILTYDGHYDMVENFIAQKYVLAQTSFEQMINEIIFDVDDYGIIPVPCGPRGQYGKWGGYLSDYNSFGIFYNAKEPEAAAMILSDLLEPLEGFETHDNLLDYAKTIFYDDAEAELFISYLADLKYNFWNEGIWDQWMGIRGMVQKGSSSSEIIGKYETPIKNLIEEKVLPDYRYILANEK